MYTSKRVSGSEGYNYPVFTGIIRHMGRLASRDGKRIRIECPELVAGTRTGDSIAVNGVCLTAAGLEPDGFSADLLDETMLVTTLGSLPPGSRLNLEPALQLGDTLGGHMLSGHVECTAAVLLKVTRNSGDCELTVAIPDQLSAYMLPKGSIAIDGVSLTIQELDREGLTVKLIPETLQSTNLGLLEPGDSVNIEPDMLVKTIHHSVERILSMRGQGQ